MYGGLSVYATLYFIGTRAIHSVGFALLVHM